MRAIVALERSRYWEHPFGGMLKEVHMPPCKADLWNKRALCSIFVGNSEMRKEVITPREKVLYASLSFGWKAWYSILR
jgi:hypothetical protein